MPFLAPLLLLAGLAVVVPLVVHLVRRERRTPTPFPSTMFLEVTPSPVASRRTVRDPWLLALRALAILAVALAFARPVWPRRAADAAAATGRREIVILLDQSFSMRLGSRWPRAVAAVERVIASLGPNDRATILPFDRLPRTATRSTGDRAQLRAALAALQPGDGPTRYAPAVAAARERLAQSDAPRKLVVLVSDLQRSGWDVTDEARLPTGTAIEPIDVADTTPVRDRRIQRVDVVAMPRAAGARVAVTARIANLGSATRALPVRLEAGARVLAQRAVDLPAEGGATVRFDSIAVSAEGVAARVVLPPDALPATDTAAFVLAAPPALPVLVISARPSPFLTSALSIGDAPPFAVTVRTPTSVAAADLAGQRVVMLADGAFPTGIGAARLMAFVESGGAVVHAVGDATDPRRWPASAAALLPGPLGPVRATDAGRLITFVERTHPALASLDGADWSAPHVRRVRAITATQGVLARLDDGTALLTEHTVGRGRVLTLGTSLDGRWNDLPRYAFFLPLLQQLTRHAAAWQARPPVLEVGTMIRPDDLAGVGRVERWVSTAPSGERTTVGGADAAPTLELREAGIHALRPGGTPGARPLLVAAQVAAAEFDGARLDPLAVRAALEPSPAPTSAATPRAEEGDADREARQSLWWYLLLGVTLLLIAEALVAGRLARRAVAEG